MTNENTTLPPDVLRAIILRPGQRLDEADRVSDDDALERARSMDWREVQWIDIAAECPCVGDAELAGAIDLVVDRILPGDMEELYGLCVAALSSPGFVRARALLLRRFLAAGLRVDDALPGIFQGGSLLGLAASFGRADLVAACLAESPAPDARSEGGASPLEALAAEAMPARFYQDAAPLVLAAEALLRAGASPFCEDGSPIWTLIDEDAPPGLAGVLKAAAERDGLDGPDVLPGNGVGRDDRI